MREKAIKEKKIATEPGATLEELRKEFDQLTKKFNALEAEKKKLAEENKKFVSDNKKLSEELEKKGNNLTSAEASLHETAKQLDEAQEANLILQRKLEEMKTTSGSGAVVIPKQVEKAVLAIFDDAKEQAGALIASARAEASAKARAKKAAEAKKAEDEAKAKAIAEIKALAESL